MIDAALELEDAVVEERQLVVFPDFWFGAAGNGVERIGAECRRGDQLAREPRLQTGRLHVALKRRAVAGNEHGLALEALWHLGVLLAGGARELAAPVAVAEPDLAARKQRHEQGIAGAGRILGEHLGGFVDETRSVEGLDPQRGELNVACASRRRRSRLDVMSRRQSSCSAAERGGISSAAMCPSTSCEAEAPPEFVRQTRAVLRHDRGELGPLDRAALFIDPAGGWFVADDAAIAWAVGKRRRVAAGGRRLAVHRREQRTLGRSWLLSLRRRSVRSLGLSERIESVL